jgi:hypothetical protein
VVVQRAGHDRDVDPASSATSRRRTRPWRSSASAIRPRLPPRFHACPKTVSLDNAAQACTDASLIRRPSLGTVGREVVDATAAGRVTAVLTRLISTLVRSASSKRLSFQRDFEPDGPKNSAAGVDSGPVVGQCLLRDCVTKQPQLLPDGQGDIARR